MIYKKLIKKMILQYGMYNGTQNQNADKRTYTRNVNGRTNEKE